MRSGLLLASAIAAAIALAGCGAAGTSGRRTAAAAGTTTSPCPDAAKARRHVARVAADLAALRRAARSGSHPATSRATDRFLLDVAYEPALRRNRLIDHAAAAVLGVCEDCFQALEAERPIPSLKYGGGC